MLLRRVFDGIMNAVQARASGDMTEAEFNRVMEEAAAKKGEKLDWQHSVVDTMKVLDLPSSLKDRQDLADELDYPGYVDGSAESNIGLHKAVMAAVAERCVPMPK